MVTGARGERRVPAAALFAAAMRSALAPDEILCALELPPPAGGHGYHKLKLGASSWPIATAAANVVLDADGRVTAVRLALGGVAAVPLAVDLDGVLVGAEPTAEALAAAAAYAGSIVEEPWGDELAPASYRAAVAAPVARRALAAAARTAAGGVA